MSGKVSQTTDTKQLFVKLTKFSKKILLLTFFDLSFSIFNAVTPLRLNNTVLKTFDKNISR